MRGSPSFRNLIIRWFTSSGASSCTERTAECNGHPPVLLPPQHHGWRCDAIETSFDGGEAKLPEHTHQSPRVLGLGRRGVVLIHVSLRDLACIKVGGPEKI